MCFKNVFVTVGTTKFDDLIETVLKSEIFEVLKSKNCKKLKLQIGNGEYKPQCQKMLGIEIEYYKFKDSILEDIANANLVISHAGAGTCLDVLKLKKNLIVVINDKLMDNHQTELADKLAQNLHVFSSTCDTLSDVLKSDFTILKPFTNDNGKKCAHLIERILHIPKEE